MLVVSAMIVSYQNAHFVLLIYKCHGSACACNELFYVFNCSVHILYSLEFQIAFFMQSHPKSALSMVAEDKNSH